MTGVTSTTSVKSSTSTKKPKKSLSVRDSTLLKILQGKTCYPLSLGEFKKFLETREFSAENLAVVEWFISYRTRFNALPTSERERSPPPASSDQQGTLGALSIGSNASRTSTPDSPGGEGPTISLANQDLEFFQVLFQGFDAQNTPDIKLDQKLVADIGRKDQPFRSEVNAAIKLFFTTEGSMELNVPGTMRKEIVSNAALTTHPAVFAPAVKHCFDIMQSSSLPSFMRFAAQNIQKDSRIDRGVKGIVCFILAFIMTFLLIWFNKSRWTRLGTFPLFQLSASFLYTVHTRMCLLNHMGRKKEVIIVDQDLEKDGRDDDNPRGKLLIHTVEEPMVFDMQTRIKLETLALATVIGACLTTIAVAIPEHF
ncbi:uncharacterized protein SPPG_06343 [Spizellomyces punctatus DAOM BR117]|uniref:RGS domain-containing protein n=1 Tax=Spizellomyces punctatus (strain DAOM BR117) TaxID=645134 RepID=A0A0L0HBV4_SPIPD|nr:uncharacterized protein SPPG_06343 [Spizellomyces punctatus DAOM BR117]KNC98662.1 hypothetical protein SPPG_06343 [Spizellomyces punctatus DAOM BR117]|eukprot:XP_016606702.1 hypothetical protein SPPG_06343 [Spizellomyces punctatus DAOM BR117]